MQRSNISMALAAVSLRDLVLVQAVAAEGSFNRAARLMHISPSGLSHQIQKVEQALGAPLFERGGRRILPTAAGQRLLAHVDAVLKAGEDLEHAAQAAGAAFGGELRLGVPSTLGPYLLPHLIEPFPQRFPGARLTLSEGKPRGLLRRLHEGELDAVLAPPTEHARGIAAQAVFFERYELLFNQAHALAGTPAVALSALRPEEATLMAESHVSGALGALDGALDEASERIQDVSLESLASLVALRGGYTLVPVLARERLASIPGITLSRVQGEAAGRDIALYWRQTTPWDEDVARFAELLRDMAGAADGLRVIGA
ncbi:LysR substrate-binding domain-containing protein [Oleiagrimonas sp. C23AA]|uniref:LysR family transcriptional regulator n=1 Tax=Oleiagrimonas sp. C23AA TaxID=2719047 RepID=UPI00142133C9|nr:LysR substrate-binding domain-containing protein [Oleiagrimonas sp. C23AA]NII10359.1 LysR family transcriptional regulator [Oleiagrimonas sp. C23AA]